MSRRQWSQWAGIAVLGTVAMLFWDSSFLWPVKILVVLFHELGHAVAAIVTGGEVISIELSPQQGGLTTTQGGLRFFVLSAGYLGSVAFGIVWLFLGRTPRLSRWGVWILAGVLIASTLAWVRPIVSFGFGFSLSASVAALVAAKLTPPIFRQWLLRALGVFSVLYAVWDIRSDVFSRPGLASDASMLAEITFIPGPVWGGIWLLIGLGTLFALRKWLVS